MAVVKIEGMSRSLADFFILLFIYTVDGTPLGDKPESREIKYGYLTYYKTDSWGKDAEATFHWPRGVVQYLFDSSSYDDMLKDKLRLSMKSLEKESCVRFKEMKNKPTRNTSSWLHFTNQNKERGCFHTPTPQYNGEIQVILGYDCLKQSQITHALMHGIGFRDEITHPKRDLYVKILWNNIQQDHWKLFGRHVTDDPELLSEYDPRSIMHFHDHAFSVNGQATISGLIPGLKIAPSENLSHLDKMKLGLKFGHECNKRKVGELLETCQDIFSKNKIVSTNEAEDPKIMTQNGTVSTDKMNSDEHNVIILGRDKKCKSGNKNSSNSFNVDPFDPGNNDDKSEESEIPQEPRMDFDYENGQNEESQMDYYEYYDYETDQNDENSKKKDKSSVVCNQNNYFYEKNNKTLNKDNEDGNHKVFDGNSGSDNNKYDKKNEEGLSNESENVSPPKLNSDSDSGDIESENTNKGGGDNVIFNNNKKLRPKSKNIAAQNDTKLSNKNNVKHVNITNKANKDDVNVVVVGHHNKLRPKSKNNAVQNNTNTLSVKYNQYNHFNEKNSKTSDKDNEDGNPEVSDEKLGSDDSKNDKENEDGLSNESENVSPPKFDFDSDSGDIESENTNKGDGNMVIFNNNKKLRPRSKNVAAQNYHSFWYPKLSNKNNVKHVNITNKGNKDDVNVVVVGHHNKLRPAAQNNTNTLSVKYNQYNHFNEKNSKTSDKDNEDGNQQVSDGNLGSDNNKYDKENEEGLSNESENVSPPKLDFDSDSGDIESESTNKGDGNMVIFNNNKKIRPSSKNIVAQNNTQISHVKNVKHMNITNKDDVNIVVIGHHDKLRPNSKNVAAQNNTNTLSVKYNQYNDFNEKYSKTLDKDNEDRNQKMTDENLVSDNNQYNKENEEGLSNDDSENVSPPNFNFDSDSGDIERENTNKGDGNIVVFNNNNKLRPNSKNIAAQNNTKISYVKSAKHVNIPNKEHVNVVVVGHHNKLRPHSNNIAAQNDTTMSHKKNVKLVNITRELANGDPGTKIVRLTEDKIKFAYADISDTSDPEYDKNISDSNDNNDYDENDANNTDDNKVI